MKKDIEIPIVKDVYVAAVLEDNKGEGDVWDIYLINNKEVPLEGVMITSRGYMETDAGTEMLSSTLRHKVGDVPAKTAKKASTKLAMV